VDNGRLWDKHGLLTCHLQNNINRPGKQSLIAWEIYLRPVFSVT